MEIYRVRYESAIGVAAQLEAENLVANVLHTSPDSWQKKLVNTHQEFMVEVFGIHGYMGNMPLQEKQQAIKIIERANEIAQLAHENQPRKQTDEYGIPLPYISHVYAVAHEFARAHHPRPEAIAAALLHDVIEDSFDHGHPVTNDDIQSIFADMPQVGEQIVKIVDGLTNVRAMTKNDEFIMTKVNFIELGLEYPEVFGIKFYDRIHNLTTIDSLPLHKQYDKAIETVMIYAPLAKRLGYTDEYEKMMELSVSIIDNYNRGGELYGRVKSARDAFVQQFKGKSELTMLLEATLKNQAKVMQVRVPLAYQQYAWMEDDKCDHTNNLPYPLEVVLILENVQSALPMHEKAREFVEQRQRLINRLKMTLWNKNGQPVFRGKSEKDHTDAETILYDGANAQMFDQPYEWTLTYSGIPVLVTMYSERAYALWHTPVSVLSQVIPNDYRQKQQYEARVAVAREQIEILRNFKTGTLSELDTGDYVQEIGLDLLSGIAVREVSELKPEKLREVDFVPHNTTLFDYLLLRHPNDWTRIRAIEIDGHEISNFSMTLGSGSLIKCIHRQEDMVDPRLVSAVVVAKHKLPMFYQELQKYWQGVLERVAEGELEISEQLKIRDKIEDVGWLEVESYFTEVVGPFDFALITPDLEARNINPEDFFFRVGLGLVDKKEIRVVAGVMQHFWGSLIAIEIKLHDEKKVSHAITAAISPHNIVHQAIGRKNHSKIVTITNYINPKDAEMEHDPLDAIKKRLSQIPHLKIDVKRVAEKWDQ